MSEAGILSIIISLLSIVISVISISISVAQEREARNITIRTNKRHWEIVQKQMKAVRDGTFFRGDADAPSGDKVL